MEEAITLLRKRGLAQAAKRAGRTTAQGLIGSYIHMGGKIGVLVEVNCESDFVARTEAFQNLVKEVAMHIAAADPKWVRREDVSPEAIEKEKSIYRAQMENSGKPANVLDKIIEGKLGSFYSQFVLLDQPFVRDDKMTVSQLVAEAIGEDRRKHHDRPLHPLPRWRRQRIADYNHLSMSAPAPQYQRILLKLSGEALMGDQQFGVDPAITDRIAQDVGEIQGLGVQTAIVIGGGNIFRGLAASARGMDRATADYMGMLATVINGLALQDALERHGVLTRVVTAIEMRAVAEPFIRRRAIRHLEKGRVVIFAAGTGNPYFTTDTAAALRAMEIKAEVILKGTKVDGVYTADPMLDPAATKYPSISYLQVLERQLKVMDATAISLCMDNKLPIVVFNLREPGNIRRVVLGEPVGTTVGV